MKKFIYLLPLFPFLLQANTATDSINILDNDSAKYAYRHLVAAPVPPDSATITATTTGVPDSLSSSV